MDEMLAPYIPLLVVVIGSGVVLAAAHILLLARHKDLGSEARLPRQLILLGMTVASFVTMIIAAPIADSTRDQVLTLLGIALSAAIALSSTSFVTNFMAAIMLRVTEPFKVGDFIKVGDLFGKVSARGLFDTEIQTEQRELIAIPNATFINQSVTVARRSGVIVSTTLSLGYDITFSEVEPLMLAAATDAGLSDPYVHIIELGDHAISYRVCGLLTDLESILTARSDLHQHLLLQLHGAAVEIASPSITRHINQPAEQKILPTTRDAAPDENRVVAESIVFDKANEIAELAASRDELKERIQQLQASGEGGDQIASLGEELASIEARLKEMSRDTD